MMTQGQITMPSSSPLVQRPLTHKLIRQLSVMGLVVAVLLLTVWWHFSSAVSHVIVVPTPAIKSSATKEISPSDTPAPTTTHLQVTTEQSPSAATNTKLEVNGRSVVVPDNGTVQQSVQSPDGNTSVNLSVDATSNGSKSTSSSTRIQMHSSSHTQVVTHDTH